MITIITIVKNAEKHLQQTIDSVVENCRDISHEYIVVASRFSKDSTLDILKMNKENISKVVLQEGDGISNALNTGVENSSGEIIAFVHSGDFLNKGILSEIQKTFSLNRQIDLLLCSVMFQEDENIKYLWIPQYQKIKSWMTVPHAGVFVRRRAFEQIGLFSEAYKVAMDFEWLLRAHVNQIPFMKLNEIASSTSVPGHSKNYWVKGAREVRYALIKAGMSSFWVNFRYCLELFKMAVVSCLIKFKLGFLVVQYKNLSKF